MCNKNVSDDVRSQCLFKTKGDGSLEFLKPIDSEFEGIYRLQFSTPAVDIPENDVSTLTFAVHVLIAKPPSISQSVNDIIASEERDVIIECPFTGGLRTYGFQHYKFEVIKVQDDGIEQGLIKYDGSTDNPQWTYQGGSLLSDQGSTGSVSLSINIGLSVESLQGIINDPVRSESVAKEVSFSVNSDVIGEAREAPYLVKCKITDPEGGTDSKDLEVQVVDDSYLYMRLLTEDFDVYDTDDSLTVDCQYFGDLVSSQQKMRLLKDQTVFIDWFSIDVNNVGSSNGVNLPTTRGVCSLVFEHVNSSISGQYSISLYSETDNTEIRNVEFSVNVYSNIKVEQFEDMSAVEREDVTLPCSFTRGNLKANKQVEWWKCENGGQTCNDLLYKINSYDAIYAGAFFDNLRGHVSKSNLMENKRAPLDIFSTELLDSGYYKCTVWDLDSNGDKITQSDNSNSNVFFLEIEPFSPEIEKISPEVLTLSTQTSLEQSIACVFDISKGYYDYSPVIKWKLGSGHTVLSYPLSSNCESLGTSVVYGINENLETFSEEQFTMRCDSYSRSVLMMTSFLYLGTQEYICQLQNDTEVSSSSTTVHFADLIEYYWISVKMFAIVMQQNIASNQ